MIGGHIAQLAVVPDPIVALVADVAATVRENCGEYFEDLQDRDTYRDPQRLSPGKKSLLMTIVLRWKQGTMTNQQADQSRDQIVAACQEKHGAELR